ncbi:hypothetical protein JB92DRAFT_1692838 [Gautieria morchelliformis]|nr:hypothetical protein JB92DRAFT_1692838 [Gautieria morchelliformis]
MLQHPHVYPRATGPPAVLIMDFRRNVPTSMFEIGGQLSSYSTGYKLRITLDVKSRRGWSLGWPFLKIELLRFDLASIVILIYDCLLTIKLEVELVWGTPGRSSTC